MMCHSKPIVQKIVFRYFLYDSVKLGFRIRVFHLSFFNGAPDARVFISAKLLSCGGEFRYSNRQLSLPSRQSLGNQGLDRVQRYAKFKLENVTECNALPLPGSI